MKNLKYRHIDGTVKLFRVNSSVQLSSKSFVLEILGELQQSPSPGQQLNPTTGEVENIPLPPETRRQQLKTKLLADGDLSAADVKEAVLLWIKEAN